MHNDFSKLHIIALFWGLRINVMTQELSAPILHFLMSCVRLKKIDLFIETSYKESASAKERCAPNRLICY